MLQALAYASFDTAAFVHGNVVGAGADVAVACGHKIAEANSKFMFPGVLHPESGVDVYAAATLKFANGVIAQVAAGVGLTQENVVRIYGSAGWLLVPSPWVINREGGASKLLLHRAGAAAPEEIVIEGGPLYALEADAFARAVRAGERDVPEMSTEDTLGNLATLDRWRAAIGLSYESERAAEQIPNPLV